MSKSFKISVAILAVGFGLAATSALRAQESPGVGPKAPGTEQGGMMGGDMGGMMKMMGQMSQMMDQCSRMMESKNNQQGSSRPDQPQPLPSNPRQ